MARRSPALQRLARLPGRSAAHPSWPPPAAQALQAAGCWPWRWPAEQLKGGGFTGISPSKNGGETPETNGFTMVSPAKSGGFNMGELYGFYQNVGVSNLWNWSGFYTGGEKCGSLVDLTTELTKRGVSVTIWLWLTWPWKITMFHR